MDALPFALDDDKGDNRLSPQASHPVKADKPDIPAQDEERNHLTVVDVGVAALLNILSPTSCSLEIKKLNHTPTLVGEERKPK
ncbi:hypothetical protein FRC12_020532 [Ceratobasidium sp. 428]|nr:hypothetical protein FRC12_020532 [Ceratobasidium sp. 428]